MTMFLVRHATIDGMRERLLGRGEIGLNKQILDAFDEVDYGQWSGKQFARALERRLRRSPS